jgi:hypothetical protein
LEETQKAPPRRLTFSYSIPKGITTKGSNPGYSEKMSEGAQAFWKKRKKHRPGGWK